MNANRINANRIFEATPGSVTLLYCDEGHFEAMVSSLRTSVPDWIRERARLNSSALISMEMCPEEAPNGFHDLAMLCSRLITAAGKRSHFEGVVMLNIAGLLARAEDLDRLKALGEVLSMEDGLASECTTLIYGPTGERNVLAAADALDFNGQLRVQQFQIPDRKCALNELLRGARLLSDSEASSELLQNTIDEMRDERRFDPLRFVQSCSRRDRTITEASIRAVLDDPFSYVNRLKKSRTLAGQRQSRQTDRRIGFLAR